MRKFVLAAFFAAATVSGAPAAQAGCDTWNPFNPQCWCPDKCGETREIDLEEICAIIPRALPGGSLMAAAECDIEGVSG